MSPYTALTAKDIELIKGYIEEYAYNDGYDAQYTPLRAPLDHILRFWNTEKLNLFNMMGQNLILKKDIEYKIDDKDLEDILCNETEGPIGEFLDSFTHYENLSLIRERSNYPNSYYDFIRLVEVNSLSTNEYTGTPFNIGKIAVVTGCKTMRVLGKVIKEYLPELSEEFEAFRLEHSRILNQRSLKGELCLSIHPLDYITMSDNDYDWESCMKWIESGDYRLGTVEMMNSPVVIEAYLAGKTDMTLYDNATWNNKKWRCLFIVTEDVIAEIRAYPYQNEYLSQACMDWIAALAEENLGWEFESKYHYFKPRNYHGEVSDHHLSFMCSAMYNDFRFTHLVRFGKVSERDIKISYSGPYECMICGEEYYDDTCDNYQSRVMCPTCSGAVICDCCNSYIFNDDTYYVDGQTICSYCFDNYVRSCPICESQGEGHEYIVTDDDTSIYIAKNDITYVDLGIYLCNCHEREVFNGEFDIGDVKEYVGYNRYAKYRYIKYEDLNEKGRELFEVDDYKFNRHWLHGIKLNSKEETLTF